MAEPNTKQGRTAAERVPATADALATAWNSEVERTCQTALATAWQLLHETAYDLGVRAFKMPEGEARAALLEAALKVKAKSDWIYWTGRSADAGAPPWHDAWLKALLGLLEYKEHLPPDSGQELQGLFSVTYDTHYRRHYWWRRVKSAIGISSEDFLLQKGMMSPTTFRKWLDGNEIKSPKWPEFRNRLRKVLPDDQQYLADEIPLDEHPGVEE